MNGVPPLDDLARPAGISTAKRADDVVGHSEQKVAMKKRKHASDRP
jgi:hypothetical protein